MQKNYLKEIQKEYSHVKPYEEDDLEWWNEGLDFIAEGKFGDAEKKFKMLVMSQHESHDGYNGLALVYSKIERFEEAEYFVDIAVEKAKESVKKGEADREILEMILNDKKEIQKLTHEKVFQQ